MSCLHVNLMLLKYLTGMSKELPNMSKKPLAKQGSGLRMTVGLRELLSNGAIRINYRII